MCRFNEKLVKKYSPSCMTKFGRIEELQSSMKRQVIPAFQKPTDPTNPNHDPVYFRSMVIYYCCFLRAQEITNSFILSFNAQLLLACILIARSAQEITAWIYVVRKKLADALDNSSWRSINNLFDKFLVGSKIFDVEDHKGRRKKIKPFGSGEVIAEMRKIIPEWGKDYDFFNEIIHFNHGGQAYYQRLVGDDLMTFDIPKTLRYDVAEHMLDCITLMLEGVLHEKGFFSSTRFPQRLIK